MNHIRHLLTESVASDQYERQVANYINQLNPQICQAERPKVSTAYSDVLVTYRNKSAWLEVKMNHTDNIGNPRVYYSDDEGGWNTTYDTPAARFCVDLLNESEEAAEWIMNFKKWLCLKAKESDDEKLLAITRNGKARPNNIKIVLPTTLSGLRLPNAVPLEIIREYVEEIGSRYVMRYNGDITDLVTEHYVNGKEEPAYYMQAGDDLYKISDVNPFHWNVPLFEVPEGTCHIRIATRSSFCEIQSEIKIKRMEPSPYSLCPWSKKKLPFKKA